MEWHDEYKDKLMTFEEYMQCYVEIISRLPGHWHDILYRYSMELAENKNNTYFLRLVKVEKMVRDVLKASEMDKKSATKILCPVCQSNIEKLVEDQEKRFLTICFYCGKQVVICPQKRIAYRYSYFPRIPANVSPL